ncbi:MAG: TonB-dependent receptor [Gammaproteobacteria bacterium]|nr:TonB-dependent receptor [Gammaproteobacteria bacterium]
MNISAKKGAPGTSCFVHLLLVSLFSIKTVLAADIIVIVKEKGSGVPVEGATVVINEGEVYDETGDTGKIEFSDIATPNKVKVLAAGFETLIVQIPQNRTKITLYLEPFVIESEGLKVTAERLEEKTSKLTLSSAELIKAAGSGGDPLKAITALPGIIAVSEGSAEVYMRGSNGNENITWVNNAPVGYLYHFGGFQSTINPALIEDINVFPGGFPVQYGDALGGVVDVKLRTPKNDRTHYKFDISTISSSFLVEGPAGETGGDSFFIAGRRSYLDLILSPGAATDFFADDDEDDPDQVLLVPRFYDFQALYRHQLDNGYLDSYVFSAGDELKMELRSSARSDPQLAGELSREIAYQTTGLTWQQRWNSQWDSLATLAYIHEKRSARIGRDELGDPFFARTEENRIHLQPELRWQIQEKSQLSFGLSSSYAIIPVDVYAPRRCTENDFDCDFTSQKKYRLDKTINGSEISPYIKYRQQWTNRLTTRLGLRHTNIEITGGFHAHQLSPRATLEYQLTPDTLLMATWGQYIQMPRGVEVIESFGNPALLMTEAEHRILGIEHQINPLYSVKAEVYHKPMKNLVIALDENDPPDNYANRGIGEAWGFDLFIKRIPSQGKIGWVSLSWASSRRTNEITGITRDFSGDQPLTFIAVWGQPFGGSWKRWDWSIKARINSGRPYTAITGRNWDAENNRWIAEYGKHNAERLPTYYKVDLRIGREVLLKESRLKFYLDLQNVTFAKNIVEYDYGNEYEKIDNPTEVTGMSFFPFFGIEMEF